MPPSSSFRLALCQILTTPDKASNLLKASQAIKEASLRQADIVVLPEMFNCPYDKTYFKEYAEDTHGESVKVLGQAAKENQKWVVGGSIPEVDPSTSQLFNTSFVFDPTGKIVAAHRKIHLFDIDIPGQRYMESETLSPGQDITVFDTPWCKVGLGICYDIRFPEQALIMRNRGAKLLLYPSSFNTTTGPLHFELLGKARALDTQCFVGLAAPARDLSNPKGYQTWGHSAIINPNGLTVAQAELTEKILIEDINLQDVERQRLGMQFESQRRPDVYKLHDVKQDKDETK